MAKIAVIDTGYDFISGETEIRNSIAITGSSQDTVGHGTKIIDEISRIAVDSEIYVIKANENGTNRFTDDNLVKAFEWAIQQDVDIINVSLSSPGTAPISLVNVVNEALALGIEVVSSTGNSYPGEIGYIANIDGVYGVGAAIYDERAYYSQDGEYLDMYATGNTLIDGGVGTSISTAFVSATMARLIDDGRGADDVYDYLLPMVEGGGKLNIKFATHNEDRPLLDSFDHNDKSTISYLIPEQSVNYDIAVSVSHGTEVYDLTSNGNFVLDENDVNEISFYGLYSGRELIGNLFGQGGIYDYFDSSNLDDGLYIARIELYDTETHDQIQDIGVTLLMI